MNITIIEKKITFYFKLYASFISDINQDFTQPKNRIVYGII